MAPLFNIYDFAPYEDHKLRLLAGGLLDAMFFNLALIPSRGCWAHRTGERTPTS